MIPDLLEKLRSLSRKLGVRVTVMAVIAILGTLVGPLFDDLISVTFKERFDREAVMPILNILASSMLAVTTFSLGVMVSAFQSAAGQATPRAYRILMQDGTTQTVLATFVGGFLFSLISLVMFRANFYSPASAVIVSLLTGIVIILIVVAILRWIGLLSELGSMDHTLRLVENAAKAGLYNAARWPREGAREPGALVEAPLEISATQSGYVTSIAMETLQGLAKSADARLQIVAKPGRFVLEGTPLVLSTARLEPGAVNRAFTLSRERLPDSDPRFGVIVIAEIGARALSPGVNDPGTAMDTIHRQMQLLWDYSRTEIDPNAPDHDRVAMEGLSMEDLVTDAFDMIIRDGADRIEVITRVIEALDTLARADDPALKRAAEEKRAYALEVAGETLETAPDLAELNRLRNTQAGRGLT